MARLSKTISGQRVFDEALKPRATQNQALRIFSGALLNRARRNYSGNEPFARSLALQVPHIFGISSGWKRGSMPRVRGKHDPYAKTEGFLPYRVADCGCDYPGHRRDRYPELNAGSHGG